MFCRIYTNIEFNADTYCETYDMQVKEMPLNNKLDI